jgi:manganese oxidase
MHASRRSFLRGVLATAGAATASHSSAQHVHQPQPVPPKPASAGSPSASETALSGSLPRGVIPVETPDVPRMPWRLEQGVKVFEVAAEHVRTEFLRGRIVDAWGFNGSMPGPTIEVTEGDRLRFIVTNRLPEPFSMHWHGLEVPIDMDGGPGISQDPIPPGGRFVYEFTVRQNGTFFYHSHMAMQEMMGMIGLFIIHPRQAHTPRVDRDFGLIFQGWQILPNNTIPDTLAMEFNWLTINGKAGPATTPMLVKHGERVRIRMVNLGMDHHPIHLHGNTFHVTGTEAGRIHAPTREPGNTILLGVAQARDIEFEATNLGDWMLHCHLPHHMMNQMMTMVGPLMMEHAGAGHDAHGVTAARAPVAAMRPASVAQATKGAPNDGMFPGYPQDMLMVMDAAVQKPETYGLRPTWSAGMMGMMTLVRVLPSSLFDRIQALRAEQAGKVVAR